MLFSRSLNQSLVSTETACYDKYRADLNTFKKEVTKIE